MKKSKKILRKSRDQQPPRILVLMPDKEFPMTPAALRSLIEMLNANAQVIP